jgi:hypothetical protein
MHSYTLATPFCAVYIAPSLLMMTYDEQGGKCSEALRQLRRFASERGPPRRQSVKFVDPSTRDSTANKLFHACCSSSAVRNLSLHFKFVCSPSMLKGMSMCRLRRSPNLNVSFAQACHLFCTQPYAVSLGCYKILMGSLVANSGPCRSLSIFMQPIGLIMASVRKRHERASTLLCWKSWCISNDLFPGGNIG